MSKLAPDHSTLRANTGAVKRTASQATHRDWGCESYRERCCERSKTAPQCSKAENPAKSSDEDDNDLRSHALFAEILLG